MTEPLIPPSPPPDPQFIQQPTFKQHRKQFEVADYKAMFDGEAVLPNFEPMPLWQVARYLPSFYGELKEGSYVKFEPSSRRSFKRALYLLPSGQFRGWNGTGFIIASGGYGSGEDSVVAGKFAVCKHEQAEGAGANHERGWHPSYCKLCGLDTSVDSGD